MKLRLPLKLTLMTLSTSFFLTACLQTNSGDGGNSLQTSETRERDPIAVDCQTVGYQAIESLIYDVLQIPEDAMFYSGVETIDFLESVQGSLGGVGVSETRSCSLLYFKSTAHLGMLACTWMSENNPQLLFPSGLSDLSTAFQTITGVPADSAELGILNELASSITSFDAQKFSSLQSKRMAAVCSAVFGSMLTQTL